MKINSELDQLLVLLMSESWNPKKVKGTNLKKQNVLPIKEYLDVHYQEKISLDFLAEHFFISKYYLTRVFKEQFGTSINSYLMNRRVTRAKFMLRFFRGKDRSHRLHLRAGGTSLFQPYFQTDGRDQSFGVQGEMAAGEQ